MADEPQDESVEEQLEALKASLKRRQQRLITIKSVIAANVYDLPDKRALAIIFMATDASKPMEWHEQMQKEMEEIVDRNIEAYNESRKR